MTAFDIIIIGLWILVGITAICAVIAFVKFFSKYLDAFALAKRITLYVDDENQFGELVVKAPNLVKKFTVGKVRIHKTYSIFGRTVTVYLIKDDGTWSQIANWHYEKYPLRISRLEYTSKFKDSILIKNQE